MTRQGSSQRSLFGVPLSEWTLTLVGLCIYTFTIVTYRFPLAQIGVAIGFIGIALSREKFRLPFPIWIFSAFLLWAYFASLFTGYANITADVLVELLKFLAIMVIVINALRTSGQIRFFLCFVLLCFLVYPARGALLSDLNLFGRKVWVNIYSNPNGLASASLVMAGISLALGFSSPARSLIRIAAFASALILLVLIISTGSRGAFIGLVVTVGPTLVRLAFRLPGRLLALGSILALAIAVAVPPKILERYVGLTEMTGGSALEQIDDMGSAAERLEVKKIAWTIFRDHPVIGVGLGAYPHENLAYAPHLGMKDAHNTFLSLAAEVGLPGLAIWCALVGMTLRYAYRCRKSAESGNLVGQQIWLERALIGFLVSGLFHTHVQELFSYLLTAIVWCSANLVAASNPRARSSSLVARK